MAAAGECSRVGALSDCCDSRMQLPGTCAPAHRPTAYLCLAAVTTTIGAAAATEAAATVVAGEQHLLRGAVQLAIAGIAVLCWSAGLLPCHLLCTEVALRRPLALLNLALAPVPAGTITTVAAAAMAAVSSLTAWFAAGCGMPRLCA